MTQSNNRRRRALLVRMDRIGDLILTLPVDEALSDTDNSWWVTKGLGFIVEAARPRRHAREVPRRISAWEFLRLFRAVRREKFALAIVFHGPWWVSFLLWLARVPIRAGVKSQWHSYLFMNRAVRQKRSRAEVSELEYNFRLVERVLRLQEGSLSRRSLTIARDPAHMSVLDDHHGLTDGGYFVVHPGMGGSALNWPASHYIDLIRRLLEHAPVVITGTAADEPYLAPIRPALSSSFATQKHPLIWLDQRLNGPELIAVLASARAVVAPSTGVLHIAASTGQPVTIGLFSPVRVQHPRRWGPRGQNAKILLPTVPDCPGEMRCLGETCTHYDCMASVPPEAVIEAIESTREM